MWKWSWPNIRLLMCFGLFRSRVNNPRLRTAMKIWSRIWLVLVTFPRCFHVADLISAISVKKYKDAIFCALVIVLEFGNYFRNIVLEVYGDDYLAIIDNIEELTKEVRTRIDKETDKVIAYRTKRSWFLFYLFTVQPMLFTFHFLFRPIIGFLLYNRIDGRVIESYSFVVRETKAQFLTLWIVEASSLCGTVMVVIFYEGMFLTMTEWILAHIDLLKLELQYIDFYDPQQPYILNDSDDELTQQTCDKKIPINDIIRHHQSILKLCSELKRVTAMVIQPTCITSAIMTVLTVYELTVAFTELGANKLMNMLEIGFAHLFHLFVLSYICEELTFQCSNLDRHFYNTDWYKGSKSQKMKLNIMVTMTNNPVYFGGFIIVNLSNFIAIMKTAFSYYNYLITVDQ